MRASPHLKPTPAFVRGDACLDLVYLLRRHVVAHILYLHRGSGFRAQRSAAINCAQRQ